MVATHTFTSCDGTIIAYHRFGESEPLIVIPGGPGCPSAYLGDLGGLSHHRGLVLIDNRGTGESAVPEDPATYRFDRLAEDVEALRAHLGISTMDLMGHSAGANVAVAYASRHPDRLRRLILLTGGGRALGVPPAGFQDAIAARSAEIWYAEAAAAGAQLDSLAPDADPAVRDSLLAQVAPFMYGEWNEQAQRHAVSFPRVPAAAAGFYDGVDLEALRRDVVRLTAPVLVVAGDLDAAPTPAAASGAAELFRNGRAATTPGGHYPWLDDPAAFVSMIVGFLSA